ncbi:MAG: hypothetical protein CMJ18_28320 [Phycisphaeraceae bacterium]|nr:hypothetical protein [Phycisphaeraceae bacterium]
MPIVVLSSAGGLTEQSPCVDLLRDAGFEPRMIIDKKWSIGGGGGDDQTIENLRDAVGVVAWGEKYPAKVISSLPKLRVIARAGVGFDSVDLEAATAHGKVVTITPNANHEAVAEHSVALMFAVAKNLALDDRHIRSNLWQWMPTGTIRGKTMGILGLGRIGRSLAKRVRGLDMTIIATEKYPDEQFVREQGIELVDMKTLLARSDYLSVHLPLSEETSGIINADTLAAMKPGAVLINTARGALVVEKDLVAALRSGHLGGAGLDVFESEPTKEGNPLYEIDNVIMTPHTAGADEKSMQDMGTEASQYIIDLSQGKWPQWAVVNGDVKDGWKF